jgi:hypothetical protein
MAGKWQNPAISGECQEFGLVGHSRAKYGSLHGRLKVGLRRRFSPGVASLMPDGHRRVDHRFPHNFTSGTPVRDDANWWLFHAFILDPEAIVGEFIMDAFLGANRSTHVPWR